MSDNGLTDELINTIAHDLLCMLPVKHGVSFSDMAREIIRLRARIAEVEHPHVETGDGTMDELTAKEFVERNERYPLTEEYNTDDVAELAAFWLKHHNVSPNIGIETGDWQNHNVWTETETMG